MIHNNKNIFYEKDFSSNQTVDISITKFKCAFFFFFLPSSKSAKQKSIRVQPANK